jgi:hypothetical protein
MRHWLAAILMPPNEKTELKKAPAISRGEALEILNISIEEYQNLIKRRLGKFVEPKKTAVKIIEAKGPLEDFLKEIRVVYKQQKLSEKNSFKFIPEADHVASCVKLLGESEFTQAALQLFFADYIKKNGIKVNLAIEK